MTRRSSTPATVYLVGAGPGDPGLLTLRAAELLGLADVVLYDYLVNPAVLEHAAEGAELVPLGDPASGRAYSPDEITARIIEEARRGRTTMRLKGGDPSVFGRGADEAGALRAAGIPFEIVPGITAGLAVAAYCEIPITESRDASAVALVAARERDGKLVTRLDYPALASFPGTLIMYMGVGTAGEWSTALIAAGKDAGTPVAIVRWASRTTQRSVRCTLDELERTIAANGIKAPAIFVVGAVAARAPEQSWFTARPLFGTRVVVPGSPVTSSRLCRRLTQLGADVIASPVIRIADPPDWARVDRAIAGLDEYDWIVFSSANGVDFFLRRLWHAGLDARRLGSVKLAAMGSGTAERLARYHLRADLVPEEFVAESLARSLLGAGSSGGGRLLLARASRGRDTLAETLRAAGAQVDEVVVYSSEDVEAPHPEVRAALAAGEIDWIPVTSSAAARSLVRLYGDVLRGVRFASIGPITSATLRELGFAPAIEASPHTTGALADAILEVHDT